MIAATVKYLGDGDTANGASVSATASDGSGQTVGPAVLEQQDGGVYRGALPLSRPGEWSITVVSENPSATASSTLSLVDDSTPASRSTPPPTQLAEEQSVRPPLDGGDDSTVRIVATAVIIIALVAAGTVLLLRRNRSRL